MALSLAARAILNIKGKPAIYKTNAGSEGVPARVVLDERASVLRQGRSELVGFSAEATVDAHINPVRGALIEIGATVYQIEQILRSPTPGLKDLGLYRLSGSQHSDDEYGAGAMAIRVLGRPVIIDGITVRAQGGPRDVTEETPVGQIVEVERVVLSCMSADVAGVRPGASAVVDGETLTIRSILQDARGLVRMILE